MTSFPVQPYFSSDDGNFVLYQGDCLELLPCLQDVDLIFADPPYFLSGGGSTCHAGRRVSVNKAEWDKPKGLDETHAFNQKWLRACQEALKKDGTLWISGTQHNIFSVGFSLQELGFKLLNTVTWFKPNAPPNLSCRFLTHSTELVLWAARSRKSKHCYDYPLMKTQAGGKQMRDVWNFSAPPPREKKFGKHPTQKPLALLKRIIQAASRPGELVVDPFTGSSTTGLAAAESGRRYIGIDSNPEYLDLSVKRYRERG